MTPAPNRTSKDRQRVYLRPTCLYGWVYLYCSTCCRRQRIYLDNAELDKIRREKTKIACPYCEMKPC